MGYVVSTKDADNKCHRSWEFLERWPDNFWWQGLEIKDHMKKYFVKQFLIYFGERFCRIFIFFFTSEENERCYLFQNYLFKL